MRTIIYLFFSLFIAVSVEAQRVSSFFIIMPDELLPQIETNRRKDMIDLFQHSQKGGITNSLGGTSDVTALSDNYISVGLSSSSTMQIKLLPLKGKEETVIAVVNTVCAPACDSRIDFYDTNWKPLDRKDFIILPDNRDFLSDDEKSNENANEMVQRVDISLMRYDFCEGNDNLQITYTIDEYMPEEMYKQIKPYLRDSSLEYVLDGNHFKKEK